MRTLPTRNYFIPLGPFLPGRCRLELTPAADEKQTVHLVTESPDRLVEDRYLSSDKRVIIPFVIEEAGNHYLRIYPYKPVLISQLIIRPAGPH